ncbi:DEAD/DEAH box helicase [Clostridium sp. AL.422]|uniref:DEAD/DEAH box helicase n=1 Tax=Clostridium TaxID=1485 RepID=UPI00293DD7EA|nr:MULTISPECIES: DEAD/DEAH box helicase [unclassified Clostridium]MDV4151637.1 DEAD/DEAH box helicase [Clostridium sp. AL.422]
MIKEVLLKKNKKFISEKCILASKKILESDLVSNFKMSYDEGLVHINSGVLSEDYFSEYNNNIELDVKSKTLISTYCTCDDFEKNEFRKENYFCKHLAATFYRFLEELDNYKDIKEKFETSVANKNIFKVNDNILNLLLEEENKEEIKLEVYINRRGIKNKITAEFKIGLKGLSSNKLYVVKDINQLLISINNRIPIKYGKDFIFDLKYQRLGIKENKIINLIEKIKDIENLQLNFVRRQDKFIDGKTLIIPDFLLREFFDIISKSRIYLNEGFFYRPVETEVIYDKPNIQFSLKELGNEYILSIDEGLPEILDKKNSIFLYGSSIYLPSFDYCYNISKYIKAFNGMNSISLSKDDELRILSHLLPKLYTLSDYVKINKTIKEKIVKEDVKFCFYFDKVNKDITLVLKVKYGEHEFNVFHEYQNKIIYRDLNRENEVLSSLRALGFEPSGDKFYLLLGDDYIFNFFKNEIVKLQEIGEVFYSENFKIIKQVNNKNIIGRIEAGKYDYLELKFKIADISNDEIKSVILAFKDNLKYYKLKNGEYLDLEEIELRNFLKLLDVLSIDNDITDDKLVFNKNKSMFINDFIKDNNLRYIKGKNELTKIQKKIKDVKKMTFKEPLTLNANLRSYQKEGYNWLKTMDYLGFGGILGDEMGLGKTIQAITFILSTLPSKTLIVAPTSLIYNWSNEIEKFAPSIKWAVLNGTKDERLNILNNLCNYDVIITTYNILKRDLESYSNINFDYCFIDEAQYIKNSNSQNALSVKKIQANRKFALTGTPIENSVLELWSIFDFIMPGYLFDEKRFSVRYYKKLHESKEVLEELNMLIQPFILRRYKKDVIKELPLKIEKKLLVSMSEEQEKVYAIYADYAKNLIEKKVKDEELNNSKIEILSYITKLRQICLDPSVLINDYTGNSGKVDSLIELLNQGIEEGHKILVFSQFTSVLKNISKRLESENISYSYLDGSISSEKRIQLIDEFNNGNNSVFLISLKAGGTGLNLTSADIVIHFDPWWNPAVEDQATDRAHRFGQKNIVEVIKLISKNTIEEKIVELQDEKRKLIEKIIDNDMEGSNINSLSEEDILNLFSIG